MHCLPNQIFSQDASNLFPTRISQIKPRLSFSLYRHPHSSFIFPGGDRERKKVYQIFLSSFTLNCLWVGSSAPVGPLLIPHRTSCLSVMNPPCPTSLLLLPPPHSLWRFLFQSLHIYFNTHFNPCTCGLSSQFTSYFASSAHLRIHRHFIFTISNFFSPTHLSQQYDYYSNHEQDSWQATRHLQNLPM